MIQAKLSSLDIQSGSFRADILEIKEQIKVLRKLPSSSKTEFTHLEKALEVLLNPDRLGVSSEEKFLMKFLLKKHKLSDIDLAKFTKLSEDIKKSCGVYGLAHHYTHTVSRDGNIHQNFVNDLERFTNLNYKRIVLVIRMPSGVGHALNLQFDKTNGIYRMCDDNMGHIEFVDLEKMKTELKEYFKKYYKGYTQYQFECYKKV